LTRCVALQDDPYKPARSDLQLGPQRPTVEAFYRIKEISQNHQKRRFIVRFVPRTQDANVTILRECRVLPG
jgi:hypothetical protein